LSTGSESQVSLHSGDEAASCTETSGLAVLPSVSLLTQFPRPPGERRVGCSVV